VYERYLALARDAYVSGDRIGAENFYQHAEHYFRVLNDSTDPQANGQGQPTHPRDHVHDASSQVRREAPNADSDKATEEQPLG
jgi:hypothetical protein